jgi:ribosomal protein L13E
MNTKSTRTSKGLQPSHSARPPQTPATRRCRRERRRGRGFDLFEDLAASLSGVYDPQITGGRRYDLRRFENEVRDHFARLG